MNTLQASFPAQSPSLADLLPTERRAPDEPPLHVALLLTFLQGSAAGTMLGLGVAMIVRLFA